MATSRHWPHEFAQTFGLKYAKTELRRIQKSRMPLICAAGATFTIPADNIAVCLPFAPVHNTLPKRQAS